MHVQQALMDGFKLLKREIESALERGQRENERFQKMVGEFDKFSTQDRQELNYQLNMVLLERGYWLTFPKDREKVSELLEEPNHIKHLYAPRIQSIAKDAGGLTIKAFREGLLYEPENLWVALTALNISARNQPLGDDVWFSKVIPSLEKAHRDQFTPIPEDGWEDFRRSIIACDILGRLVQHRRILSQRGVGRPKKEFSQDEIKAMKLWESNHFSRMKDVDKELGLTPGTTKKAWDRRRHH